MTTSKFLLKIQEELDKKPELYLENYKNPKLLPDDTLIDFVANFLCNYSKAQKTLVKKTNEIHAKFLQRRSVSDTYRICKYYFTDLTLEEMLICLAKLWKTKKLGYFYCNQTESRVWMDYNYYTQHHINPYKYAGPDEFGITPEMIKELSNKKY